MSPTDGHVAEDRGDLLEVDEVELHVLAGGEVAPAAAVGLGDVGEHVELLGGDGAVGHLHPHHLVVAALALAVDAVVQAEDPEGVLLEVAGEVPGELLLELLDVGTDLGVDLTLQHGWRRGILSRRINNAPKPESGRSTFPLDIGARARQRLEQLGHPEGQVEALAAVEAGVAHRLVAVVEVGVEDLLGAAEALGDVVAGELDVHAAGPGALGPVGGEEAGDLARARRRGGGSCGRPRR